MKSINFEPESVLLDDILLEEKEENKYLTDAVKTILNIIGEDCDREGLLKTPERVAKAIKFLTSGYKANISELINNAIFNESYDEIIIVKDIDIFSLCEHHMLPIYGKAHVAYLADKKIIGLSKIPRICDVFAKRLQVQERLTKQIALTIDEYLQPKGVIVVIEAGHMCMTMRGVQKPGSYTVTEAATGVFKENYEYKDNFYRLLKNN